MFPTCKRKKEVKVSVNLKCMVLDRPFYLPRLETICLIFLWRYLEIFQFPEKNCLNKVSIFQTNEWIVFSYPKRMPWFFWNNIIWNLQLKRVPVPFLNKLILQPKGKLTSDFLKNFTTRGSTLEFSENSQDDLFKNSGFKSFDWNWSSCVKYRWINFVFVWFRYLYSIQIVYSEKQIKVWRELLFLLKSPTNHVRFWFIDIKVMSS